MAQPAPRCNVAAVLKDACLPPQNSSDLFPHPCARQIEHTTDHMYETETASVLTVCTKHDTQYKLRSFAGAGPSVLENTFWKVRWRLRGMPSSQLAPGCASSSPLQSVAFMLQQTMDLIWYVDNYKGDFSSGTSPLRQALSNWVSTFGERPAGSAWPAGNTKCNLHARRVDSAREPSEAFPTNVALCWPAPNRDALLGCFPHRRQGVPAVCYVIVRHGWVLLFGFHHGRVPSATPAPSLLTPPRHRGSLPTGKSLACIVPPCHPGTSGAPLPRLNSRCPWALPRVSLHQASRPAGRPTTCWAVRPPFPWAGLPP